MMTHENSHGLDCGGKLHCQMSEDMRLKYSNDKNVSDRTVGMIKVRPHRTRSAAADCGLCPLRNVIF